MRVAHRAKPEGLRARVAFLGGDFLAIVVDAGFLALWLVLQWASEQGIKYFKLSDIIDNYVLVAFQVLFAISTMAPVAIQTYADIRIMVIRAGNKMRKEGAPRE